MKVHPVARAAFALAVLGAVVALASGPAYRLDVWPLARAFRVLTFAAYAALAGAVLGLVGVGLTWSTPGRRGIVLSLTAIAIGVSTFTLPAIMLVRARTLPPIHDVTTDVDDPPRLVAALQARAGAPNDAQYGGRALAEQQRAAYPDVVPLELPIAPREAFERAARAAHAMNWRLIASVPEEGRLEATAMTLFFGFKDDVVVRVRPAPGGSRIDVRSVSRVGVGDVGRNARRIVAFLRRIREEPVKGGTRP